jgi:MFS family permease
MVFAKLRQQRFYGWTALIGVMPIFFSMMGGTVIAYGLFLPFMCEGLNLSRSALSGPYTVFWIVMGLLGPVVGIAVHKFGARKNIIFGNVLAAVGLLIMSRVTQTWHVYLVFSLLVGGGQAFGTFVPGMVITNNWFSKRRSMAISLLTSAGAIGGLVLSPIIGWLNLNIGWQTTWVCLAGLRLVATVVAGILIRDAPEDMGQFPDGVDALADPVVDEDGPVPKRAYETTVDWKLRDVLRTPALWLIISFGAAHIFTLNLLTLHQAAHIQDIGFSSMVAATVSGVLSGVSVGGQLLCGVLAIRFEARYLAVIYLAGFVVGIVVFMNAAIVPLVYLYTVFAGVCAGGLVVLMPLMLGSYFGRADYARIIGWTTPIVQIIGAVSPLIGGFIYDASGSYTWAFITVVCFLGVGLVCAFFARPPRHTSEIDLKS